jgi:hypothetical protein
MQNSFFKVVSCTTENNSTGNGKSNRLEILGFVSKALPLDQAPITVDQRLQLMLAGHHEWTVTVPTGAGATRRLFGGMITSEGNRIKDAVLFNKINSGDVVAGEICRYETTPYTIGDNTVNHITIFVFEGEDGVSVANRQLGQNGSCVLIDGKATATSETMERRLASADPVIIAERRAKILALKNKSTTPKVDDVVPVDPNAPADPKKPTK